MPSTSTKQHNFMAAVANNPKFAKKVDVPMSVGSEFMDADKRKKFRDGGTKSSLKQGINKQQTNHGEKQLPNAMLNKYIGRKNGGMMKAVDTNKNPGLAKLPTEVRNKMGYMKKGGMAHEEKGEMKKDLAQDKKMVKKAVGMHDKQQHEGKKTNLTKLAKGGSFRSSANGIAAKGKTKGAMIKMNKGGDC